ncbi:hypothetical protein FRC12_017457 [Ceratobasidium sp. 428]|nr:hypothetical protein FRC12_017457 [Ceratobasidium sp. 428]
MYIPKLLLSALYFISPQREQPPIKDLTSETLDFCPKMTVRCVKGGDWPRGIVGDIGKKEFCWEGFRCNQCNIDANTDECNVKFPECEDACDPFAPIPF